MSSQHDEQMPSANAGDHSQSCSSSQPSATVDASTDDQRSPPDLSAQGTTTNTDIATYTIVPTGTAAEAVIATYTIASADQVSWPSSSRPASRASASSSRDSCLSEVQRRQQSLRNHGFPVRASDWAFVQDSQGSDASEMASVMHAKAAVLTSCLEMLRSVRARAYDRGAVPDATIMVTMQVLRALLDKYESSGVVPAMYIRYICDIIESSVMGPLGTTDRRGDTEGSPEAAPPPADTTSATDRQPDASRAPAPASSNTLDIFLAAARNHTNNPGPGHRLPTASTSGSQHIPLPQAQPIASGSRLPAEPPMERRRQRAVSLDSMASSLQARQLQHALEEDIRETVARERQQPEDKQDTKGKKRAF